MGFVPSVPGAIGGFETQRLEIGRRISGTPRPLCEGRQGSGSQASPEVTAAIQVEMAVPDHGRAGVGAGRRWSQWGRPRE